jgi:RNA polymerase sigma factor (sigma-70 family)
MNLHIEGYTDTQIIEKVLAGETALYEMIIRRYNPYLYKTGRSYGFGHADTEDLMQETYINAYKSLHGFEFRAGFKTWLLRIMLNNCYHRKKKESLRSSVISELTNELTENIQTTDRLDTENAVTVNEIRNIIESALLNIPEQFRIVFSLRELSGLSTADTADILAISEQNVKVRFHRAKSLLRTEIEKMYSTEEIFEFNLIYCDKMVNKVLGEIAVDSRI